uniref:Uncharacterized protein n=1 Tax=Cyprinus carpio TaxID=7962 RepID=A0A8C1XU90_CYPCA
IYFSVCTCISCFCSQDKCVMTTSIICTCSLFLKSCFCLTDVLSMTKMINVFSKLKPVEGARVFWSGSVFDISLSADLTIGVIEYFPSNHVNKTQIFQKKTIEIPTTVSI